MEFKINLGNIIHILSLIKKERSFNLEDLAENVNLSSDKLLYSLTILSEVYSSDGDSFINFEVNLEKNVITFEFNESLASIPTITDLDLFKIYTVLNNPKINVEKLFDNKSDLIYLYNTLNNYFKSHQSAANSAKLDFNRVFVSDELYIEYIKLGHNISNIYKIKPLSFNITNDGDVLEAYDYEDDKIKSFLIERIVNFPEEKSLKERFSNNDNKISVTYQDLALKRHQQHFRSEEIAVEHFLKNIDSQNVIAPNSVRVEIEKRKNKLIAEFLS
jgi:hypothetical protein